MALSEDVCIFCIKSIVSFNAHTPWILFIKQTEWKEKRVNHSTGTANWQKDIISTVNTEPVSLLGCHTSVLKSFVLLWF